MHIFNSLKNIVGSIFLIQIVSFFIFTQPIKAEVVISQQLTGDGISIINNITYYIPGKSLQITISFTNTSDEKVLALGLQTTLPATWQFQGVSTGETAPAVFPQAGKISDGTIPFEFAWINIPPFPFEFTFSVNIPSEFEKNAQITSQALYRYTGGQLRSNIVQNSLESTKSPKEKCGCSRQLTKGCNNADSKIQMKKVITDLFFILMILGILGSTTKK